MASQKHITKKIINSPETCVDDNLRGVVATYLTLRLHPKHRVVTVRSKSDSGRVAVLGGGGSGHEPFAAGLVGAGMLDGAVAGGVFASPPTGHVLYAIHSLYKYNSAVTAVACLECRSKLPQNGLQKPQFQRQLLQQHQDKFIL